MTWWQRIFAFSKCEQSNVSQNAKHSVGRAGEEQAVQYLTGLGMRILYQNWRCGSLELDVVGEDAQGIVFVEVKTRKAQSMTSPLEGMTPKKRATLIRAAKAWLAAHEAQGVYEKPCRFAVVAVTYEQQKNTEKFFYKVEFHDHAFDLSHTY